MLISIFLIFYRLHTSTRKQVVITSFATGKVVRCKEEPRVPVDGWRDMFCLTVATNPSDASSTVAVADLALR